MGYVLLGFAIAVELIATSLLKISDGFRAWLPAAAAMACYLVSFYLLARALLTMQVGIAYAIWAGVGTLMISVIGIIFFDEPAGPLKLLGVGLVISGVLALNLSGAD